MLETKAADFFTAQAALFLGGGFQALPAQGDLVLHDALIHASAHEGMRLGRADIRAFAHNDVGAARVTLEEWRSSGEVGQVWIAVESVYSMEGDRSPLSDLAALAGSADAVLVVDEAHATGVFGEHGSELARGLDEEILTLHTCGKSLGVSWGLICGPRVVIDALVNRPPFIFATAPSPFEAAMVRALLRALKSDPNLQIEAPERMAHAHREARRHCGLHRFVSQIMPVILRSDEKTMAKAAALQSMGFDMRGIRPPSVARGTPCLSDFHHRQCRQE